MATFAVWQCALFGAGAAVVLVLVSLAVARPRSSSWGVTVTPLTVVWDVARRTEGR